MILMTMTMTMTMTMSCDKVGSDLHLPTPPLRHSSNPIISQLNRTGGDDDDDDDRDDCY